jgi:tryptophan-rich sensory protein
VLAQLLFNALWSPLFSGLRHPALALADIVRSWATRSPVTHVILSDERFVIRGTPSLSSS